MHKKHIRKNIVMLFECILENTLSHGLILSPIAPNLCIETLPLEIFMHLLVQLERYKFPRDKK
jgi:hypothetical protein